MSFNFYRCAALLVSLSLLHGPNYILYTSRNGAVIKLLDKYFPSLLISWKLKQFFKMAIIAENRVYILICSTWIASFGSTTSLSSYPISSPCFSYSLSLLRIALFWRNLVLTLKFSLPTLLLLTSLPFLSSKASSPHFSSFVAYFILSAFQINGRPYRILLFSTQWTFYRSRLKYK